MSTSFQKLIEHLTTTRELGPPTTTRFREHNIDEIARTLNLDEKAASRAENPTTSAQNTDEAELSILAYVREQARHAATEFHGALDTYESRLRDASIDEAAFVMIKAAGEEGLANFHAQSEEDGLPLQRVEDDARRTIRQFEKFVSRNRLQDTAAIIVDSRERASALLWITAIIVIESIVNGLFFATGSETGLIGGVTEALSLSVINVSLASILGLFSLRYVRHVGITWRITAVASLLVIAIMILGLNGLIAHYREAFQQMAVSGQYGNTPDFRDVLNSFVYHPFALQDAKSWLLGIIGIVMNAFASWKFYSLSDPYPGFGSIASRRRNIILHLSDVRKDCIQALTDHRNYATDQMASVISKLSAKKNEFEVVLRSRERLSRDYEEYMKHLGELCVRLSYRYRAIAGIDGPPLDARIPAQVQLSAVYTQDSSAHSRAIETMDGYLLAISAHYTKCVKMVGENSSLSALGAVNA